MNETANKIIKNPLIIFIVLISDLFNLVKPIWQSNEQTGLLKQYYSNYDWAGFLLQLLTVIFLYVILGEYIKLKKVIDEKTNELISLKKVVENNSEDLTDNIQLSHVIGTYRHKREYDKKQAQLQKYSNLPLNSQTEFEQELILEYKGIKELLAKTSINKTPKQIEEFVLNYYPSNFRDIK